MADNHCFVGRREVGKTRLKTSASSSANKSAPKSPQKLSDILRMRRLRLGRGRTTLTNSMSDSCSEPRHTSTASRTSSNSVVSSVPSLLRQNSTHSYQSARSYQSTKSNATALTALSSLSGSERSSSRKSRGKLRRYSKYDEEISDGQLGINEKELVSMNKHIPALKSHGKSATFRQHYYPEGGWGWVITFCCFIANLFTTGLQLSFGVLYLEILKHCGEETSKISVVWIGATNLGVSHLISPLLVALCRRKSTRLTAVVGGLVMALSLLFASFARHYHQIFLSYGLLFGLGCSMVRETSTLMLSQYFKRKRELVEMVAACGSGAGIAIFTNIYHAGFGLLGWRFGLQAISVTLSSLFFVGLFYRSASLYHPQRRAILHLKDMSKRKGKDKAKIESKPPYFDFSMLSARSFQVILVSTSLACLGVWSPIFYFVPLAFDEGLKDEMVVLQSFLGLAHIIGTLGFGAVIKSRSQQCLISRQYLLQASLFGIGISMLALLSVEGYHGYLLFVWMYGIFLGGFELTLKVYTFERVRVRQFTRGWGYVQGAKALPLLIGLPITGYISESMESPKAGIYFSFALVLLAATVLFLMKCFRNRYITGTSLHNELCKMDTGMTSSEANGVIQNHQENGQPNHRTYHRPSDATNYSEMDGSRRPSAVIPNGLIPELAHLECTCEKGFNFPRTIAQATLSTSTAHEMQKPIRSTEGTVDDVAVLEEEDVVLDDEDEVEKIEEDEEDEDLVAKLNANEDDDDDEDIIGPIFEEEEDEEYDGHFKPLRNGIIDDVISEEDEDEEIVKGDQLLYKDLLHDVISEADENEDEENDDEPSRGIMWSEAAAALELESEAGADPKPSTRHLVRLKMIDRHFARPTRSQSESDLARTFDPKQLNSRLPPSARSVEKQTKKGSSKNQSKVEAEATSEKSKGKLLGSVGQLLVQFQRQKSWHKFKSVHHHPDTESDSSKSMAPEVSTFV